MPMEKILQLSSAVTSLSLQPTTGNIVFSTEQGDIFRLKDSPDAEQASAELLLKTTGNVSGIAYDSSGRLIICDVAQQALLTHASGEEMVNIIDEFEEEPLNGPNSLIIDSKGSIFFTDSGPLGSTSLGHPAGSVFVIDSTDHVLHAISHNTLAHPCGIALSPDESAIYIAETLQNRILRFVQKPRGVFIGSVFHQFSGGLGPTGLDIDGSGNIYVARSDVEGTNSSGMLSILKPNGSLLGSIASPFPELLSVAIGPPTNPYIYLSEKSTKSLYRVPIEDLPL